MEITDEMKSELATLIVEELKKEFANIHLSGNLMNTIQVYKNENGNWVVDIPAIMYNFKTYFSKGIIVPYNGDDSYANLINKTGGFSGKHKDYAEKCIKTAIQRWLAIYNIKSKVR